MSSRSRAATDSAHRPSPLISATWLESEVLHNFMMFPTAAATNLPSDRKARAAGSAPSFTSKTFLALLGSESLITPLVEAERNVDPFFGASFSMSPGDPSVGDGLRRRQSF